MRLLLAAIVLGAILPGVARAQVLTPRSFGTGEFKARPDEVEENLVGTPRDLRTLPRAPTLPDLTHRASELSGENTIASLKLKGPPDQPRASVHIFHFDFEAPLGRGFYAGAEWAFAAAHGATDTAGTKFVSGQPMLFGRAVHNFQNERYSVGAGLGLLPPLFAYDDRHESDRIAASTASTLAAVVRPWDLSTFLDRRLTARPWIDLRVQWRRAVVQARQGVDVNFRSGAPSSCAADSICDKTGDLQLLSISTLYLGWQPTREMALGVEAWQVYLLQTRTTVADRDRSAFAISPSVRFYYRWVEPAVSLLFPIGSPLLGAADSYFGLRIDVRVWFGGK